VLAVDSSTYAHFVFNVFDQDRDGTVSFEVRTLTEVRFFHSKLISH